MENNKIKSSLLLIAISFNAVLNDIIMKTLAIQGLDPLVINGVRIFFSCIIGTFFGLWTYGPQVFNNFLDFPHWVRNLTTIGALWAVIYALSFSNIAQVDLITYLIPGFISLISTFFFREKFNFINFFLVLICIGTFLVRKGFLNTLPLIMSAALFAFAEVWIKHKMHYKFWTMIISLGFMGSLLLGYFFIPHLIKFNTYQLLLSILIGVGDISILWLITWKSRVGTSHDYLPLRYTSIIFAILADKIFFKSSSIDYIMVAVVIFTSISSILLNKK